MNRTTIRSIPFAMLKSRFKLEEWQAIGLLESIWFMTASSCPQGDIGRFSDDDIAVSIGWSGDCTELIDGLVRSGFLMRSHEFRLVISDWDKRIPCWALGNLAKRNLKTVTSGGTPQSKIVKSKRAISAGLRFHVLMRDCFTCQYCGKKAPDVPIHCDHRNPVANGGLTVAENLVTSCEECNLGKSDKIMEGDVDD